MTALCRDCGRFRAVAAGRCESCGGRRLVRHGRLAGLAVAHVDCDAFYASVEKRDDPSLRDRPVIVGGGRRGVVSAACYVARLYGVRSAMPMFKALAACPQAVVIRPDMAKYRVASLQIRALMETLTPLVEPLSLDEAYLDLGGTAALHRAAPAELLARLATRVEQEVGVTVSIGLGDNKLLAKLASELDKPRGFAVLAIEDAPDFLAGKPVGILPRVGAALQASLKREGITRVGDLLSWQESDLVLRFGAVGRRLFRAARGEDSRRVEADSPAKSISAETTFDVDERDPAVLSRRLWPLCEKVARRLKRAGLSGGGVVLKLKTGDFRTITRSRHLDSPTQLAGRLFDVGDALLRAEARGERYRLIGIGAVDLAQGVLADPPDLLEPGRERSKKIEQTIDDLRARLGEGAIMRGRSLPVGRPGGKGS